MKIRKTATQKNVVLAIDFYTPTEVMEMLESQEIFHFTGRYGTEVSYEYVDQFRAETVYRIFTEALEEIKVVCEDGFYCTVAIGKNGKKYYVNL